MFYHIQDYNNANELFNTELAQDWLELKASLDSLTLDMKESDQAGKQGSLIFNPVGTNKHFEDQLNPMGWAKVKIPSNRSYFGKDFDFGKNQTIVEVQFSNYPFLMNNTIRSEVFYREQLKILNNLEIKALVIITKAKRLPASNSTLDFDLAKNQLTDASSHDIFSIPVRLIGLDLPGNSGTTQLKISKYSSERYSRTLDEDNNTEASYRLTSSGKKLVFDI